MKTETGLLNIRLAELLKFHLPKTLNVGIYFVQELYAYLADVCLEDNSVAKKILQHWRQTRHFYDPRSVADEADNPVFAFFESTR